MARSAASVEVDEAQLSDVILALKWHGKLLNYHFMIAVDTTKNYGFSLTQGGRYGDWTSC